MGLTQVSKDGVKNDAIDASKLPANSVGASELADNAVDTNAIADQAVALSKLPHGDGSSNGKFLRANNGADPSFESIPAGTTINNNADNRVITGSGTANTLEAESGLTYDGQQFKVETVTSESNALRLFNTTTSATVYQINGEGNSFVGHTYPRSDANLDLGFHSGNRWRDVILSGGIRFGSANSSDYLDDYEEGTFTPQFAGVGGGPTSITFGSVNGGNYVKIGNLVFVSGRSEITASSGGSQHWLITNMPFVSKSGGRQFESIGHIALENFSIPDNVIDLVAVKEQGNNNMLFSGTRKDNTLTNGISHGADQVYNVTFAVCYRTA